MRRSQGAARLFTAAAMFVGAVGVSVLAAGGASSAPVTGAAFTTVNTTADPGDHCKNGNPNVNCNIYDGKQYVWLSGGPVSAGLSNGTYFFAVLEPSGQNNPNDGGANNLSDDYDAIADRTFTISNGVVSYIGPHLFNSGKIRLDPYADTGNPGGVYILAICSLGSGYPVTPANCKYDAFKVQEATDPGPVFFAPDISKDAAGAYDNTYTWTIAKAVDKTTVKQVGGSATFNYTVSVTHDSGTISGVKVTGQISVVNGNTDSNGDVIPITVNTPTDQLSDSTVCTVSGGSTTLTTLVTVFDYSCSISGGSVPSNLDNTVTLTWPAQKLTNGADAAAGSASFTVNGIAFTQNAIDECTGVSDSYAGSWGTLCVPTTTNPTAYTYARTVPVPAYDCVSYGNTATFTATDSGATGSASQSVQVCGPAKTGALTMGFWQNPNGQGIIKGQAATGVCPSATWLRGYAPFQDLSATATCAQVATYVTNIIKAANASGAAMNAMLKAQMLSTALDVYFSNSALGGNKINAPGPVGSVDIDLTKICKNIGTCSIYENTGGAFGGATHTTVSQLLSYAASKSNVGGSAWYGQVKATQELAKDTFDAINNQVAFKF